MTKSQRDYARKIRAGLCVRCIKKSLTPICLKCRKKMKAYNNTHRYLKPKPHKQRVSKYL